MHYNKKLNPLTLEEYKSEECIKAFQEYWEKNDSHKKNFDAGRLRISLTEGCNFRCPYCFNEGMACKSAKSFSIKDISTILEASEGIVKRVKLTGGEPLFHKDIVEIIKICSEKYQTTLTTNGSLLEKISSVADKLAYMRVSVPSLDEHEYKQLTGSNYSPKDIFKKIQELKRITNIHTSLNVVVNSVNIENLREHLDQMSNVGIDRIRLFGIIITDSDFMKFYYPSDKIKAKLDDWFGSPKMISASQLEYKTANGTSIELFYHYCFIGCNVCRTNGHLRITPEPEISYCLAKKGISIEKEIQNSDVKGLRKALLSAIDLMG
ncbi:MAG TPA: radical SAM protein [Rickettsiales bacterium]|nr:radical SAM protein [Rickettsiales bacterium]